MSLKNRQFYLVLSESLEREREREQGKPCGPVLDPRDIHFHHKIANYREEVFKQGPWVITVVRSVEKYHVAESNWKR